MFILSGAEDLVPLLNDDGTRFVDDATDPAFIVWRYRPRVEGLFARIERWTGARDGQHALALTQSRQRDDYLGAETRASPIVLGFWKLLMRG